MVLRRALCGTGRCCRRLPEPLRALSEAGHTASTSGVASAAGVEDHHLHGAPTKPAKLSRAKWIYKSVRSFSASVVDPEYYDYTPPRIISATNAKSTEGEGIYGIEILTGDFRGAGTDDEVSIRLYGQHGESEEILLEDDDHDGTPWEFKRNSRRLFTISAGDLGEIHKIQVSIRRRSSDNVTINSWFLDRVRVFSPSGRFRVFPYGSWLGESEDGDLSVSTHCDLVPIEDIVSKKVTKREQPLEAACGAFVIPNPDSWTVERREAKGAMRKHFGYGGEDAYFTTPANSAGALGLGVSDGVYMWRLQGIDAGEYSKRLMSCCAKSINNGETDVVKITTLAARTLKTERLKGSATMCVVVLDTTSGLLHCSNLGDSGFVILRHDSDSEQWNLMYKSPQQEHHFGCPYQLGHQATANHPEDAMVITRIVEPGDMIILGSDGLFDNLHDNEIVEAVHKAWGELEPQQRQSTAGARHIAQGIANSAFFFSLDKHRDTPYSQGATEEFDMVYSGGKPDDITVVAAVVS